LRPALVVRQPFAFFVGRKKFFRRFTYPQSSLSKVNSSGGRRSRDEAVGHRP